MAVRIGGLGSLRDSLNEYKVKFAMNDPHHKRTKFIRIKDAVLDRIKLIEKGRKDEMKWLGDINNFVTQLEKLAEIKFVTDKDEAPAEEGK